MRIILSVTALAACTQGAPLRTINADESSVSSDDLAETGPSPIIAAMAGTPYQGTIELSYPAVDPSSAPIDDAGAVGVGQSVQLVTSAPGGRFCPAGAMLGSCCITLGHEDAPVAFHSAGSMAIVDATAPGTPTTHGAWDVDTGYSWLPPRAFRPGDRISISASGDVIDAFSATAVVPVPLVGLPVEFRSSNWDALAVSRSNNWTFHWVPAGASFFDVSIDADLGQVRCRVPDDRGSVEIPASVLATIASVDATGFAAVYRGNSAPMVSDNLDAELDVTMSRSYVDLQF